MKKTVWGILLLLLLAFIWGNSLLSRETSAGESMKILELIRPFLAFFLGEEQVTHHLVRKLAHFTEFAALGFVLYGNVLCRARRLRELLCANIGFFIAFADETLQIFSGRGPQIQDVWLDFAGVVAGTLFALVLFRTFAAPLFPPPATST